MLGNTKFFATVALTVGAFVVTVGSPAYAPEAVASPAYITVTGSAGFNL